MLKQVLENKGIKSFYIHPQSAEDLTALKAKVNGVPAYYTFTWTCDGYKPKWTLKVTVEATNITDAEVAAKQQVIKSGIPVTDKIILTLNHLDNKVYRR